MNVSIASHAITALLVVGLFAVLAGPSHAQFVDYDDFSSGVIDPDKWHGLSTEGAFASPTARALRVVDNGALRLSLTSWGGDTSDSGSAQSAQRLRIRQLGALGGSGFITGLRAKVTVLAAEAEHCTGNAASVNSATASRARALLQGTLFNDGRGGPGDSTGNVMAEFDMWRNREGASQIIGFLEFCTNPSCSSVSTLVNTDFFAHPWSIGVPLVLEILWDAPNAQATFAVRDPDTLAIIESRTVVYPAPTNVRAPQNLDFKDVRVVNTVENCASVRKHVVMDALFDNVQVRRQP
jgi:hypothetical protein